MTRSLRLAMTADLHWGPHPRGDAATRLLVDFLRENPPDVLVLAGDVGAGDDFDRCLALFDGLPCIKALVPGNHDIWVNPDDSRGDSLVVYRSHLPRICAAHGFHYLDGGPLPIRDAGIALVGSMNWYDYSWTIDQIRAQLPDWEYRLATKTFTRGRHNDSRFVRWPFDDRTFTAEAVAGLERHLAEVLGEVETAIVVTHHPAIRWLTFPRVGPPSEDGLLWDAFSGNLALEEVLARHAARSPFLFSGHTHRAREEVWNGIRCYNIGGDYHFKRLLWLELPGGEVTAHTFGEPG